MAGFKLVSNFKPTGDQPQAIKKLIANIIKGSKHQVLLGVTGSGKTFTMADDNDPMYPDFPKVFFVNDVFNGFDYMATVDNDYFLSLFELGVGNQGAYFTNLTDESFSIGDISFREYSIRDRNLPPSGGVPSGRVPDAGATSSLLLAGFGAISLVRRKRQH